MSFNGKTTLEKGGRDPPNVSLEYIVNDLLSYFNEFKSLHNAKKKAEDKYGIKKEHDNCWPADDIKRAWGKTQRMEKTSFRRQHWTLVIMLQVIQKQMAGNLIQSECRSSQSTAEQATMGAAGGVKQHSGGNHQTSSYPWQTGGVSQNNNGTETIYIRIPRFVMIHNEERGGERFRNIDSRYKLIDGVPETGHIFNEIRKRKSYVMSFNYQTRNANWVYEILNRYTTADNRVKTSPYRQTYHRGHLAAAANHRWCWEAIDDADVIDNIVPQHRTLNTGPWRVLENDCRTAATAQNNIRNVHVYSGPLYLRDMVPRTLEGKWLPSHFFKVIIKENEDGTVNQPQYYLFPNGNLPGENLNSVEEHRRIKDGTNMRDITIEDIQNASGLRFIAIGPNMEPRAREITVRLHGEDGNAVRHTADIQITISP